MLLNKPIVNQMYIVPVFKIWFPNAKVELELHCFSATLISLDFPPLTTYLYGETMRIPGK